MFRCDSEVHSPVFMLFFEVHSEIKWYKKYDSNKDKDENFELARVCSQETWTCYDTSLIVNDLVRAVKERDPDEWW